MDGSALTPFAWFFMILSMGAVTALTIYCYRRILTGGTRLTDPEMALPDADDAPREVSRPEPYGR